MSNFAAPMLAVSLALSIGAIAVAAIQMIRGKDDEARGAAIVSGYGLLSCALGYAVTGA